jgi:hypothetical protein
MSSKMETTLWLVLSIFFLSVFWMMANAMIEKAQVVEPTKAVTGPNIQRVDIDGYVCFVLDTYRGISCVVKP